MPQKHKKSAAAFTASGLRSRVEQAVEENRTQTALDLAKQFHRQEKTADSLALLKKSYLARGRQLREQGKDRDALMMLEAALPLDPADSAWQADIALEMARNGGVARALALGRMLHDAAQVQLVAGHAVDAAVRLEKAGRGLLPEDLHGDFDRVLQAFADLAAGADDACRERLDGVGLRSPFLEWKLFLRGLQAYYAGDDARTLENWHRLNPERTPARLAAPFRMAIDPTFQTAQPPAAQNLLRQQFERLQASPLLQQLRGLRTALLDKGSLMQAFRIAEAVVPLLRQERPELVARLAYCCYWAVLETGPEDVLRYTRVFGKPTDDPNFTRLRAIALENSEPEDAHKCWKKYEAEVQNNAASWPNGLANRARALIWLRMGDNAAAVPGKQAFEMLPPSIRAVVPQVRPLSPPAPQCFRRCIELAPDLIDGYEAMCRYFDREGPPERAIEACRELLERFPNHAPTLESLALEHIDRQEYSEAVDLLQRALRQNPLNRKLRVALASAQLGLARIRANEDRFDEARAACEAAEALHTSEPEILYSRRAAVEWRAGDAAAAEGFLEKARQAGASTLTLAFRMLAEVARLKLAAKVKKRFDQEYKAALAAPTDCKTAARLAVMMAVLDSGKVKYHGCKTHLKAATAYLESTLAKPFTAVQLRDVASALLTMKNVRLARRFIDRGIVEFPTDPHFPFLSATAYLDRDRLDSTPTWQIEPLLTKAERLARALPPGEDRESLLEKIDMQMNLLRTLNPLGMGLLDSLGGLFDEEDELGDDDFDDDDF